MLRIAGVSLTLLWGSAALAEVSVSLHYLREEVPPPPRLSNLDETPEDDGVAGAELGIADNLTTGQFLNHVYELSTTSVPPEGDVLTAAREVFAQTQIVLLDATAETLLAIADLPEAQDAVIFNVASPDMALRSEACRANVLHTIPSYAMRADGVMQFLVQKRWTDLAMISGTHASDQAFAEALRNAAAKFQLRVRAEKTWEYNADMRRNASQEVPLFTQDFPAHDVLIVADEVGDFARYVMYNTWEARPLAGSEGIAPVAWSPVLEQWGATQLQNRFVEISSRAMSPKDYAAWAAIRTVGEAVTRTDTADIAVLREYILSAQFELAGFKGRPMSYRAWNGQLRQPIPLVHPRAVVAMAPLEGFLHPRSELDTLGLDAPENACTAFGD